MYLYLLTSYLMIFLIAVLLFAEITRRSLGPLYDSCLLGVLFLSLALILAQSLSL